MSSCEELKRYEMSQERVDKGADMMDSLSLIINAYKNDKDMNFREYAYALDEIRQEIEKSIAEDVEIVDEYEHEEYEDELRSMSDHEF